MARITKASRDAGRTRLRTGDFASHRGALAPVPTVGFVARACVCRALARVALQRDQRVDELVGRVEEYPRAGLPEELGKGPTRLATTGKPWLKPSITVTPNVSNPIDGTRSASAWQSYGSSC